MSADCEQGGVLLPCPFCGAAAYPGSTIYSKPLDGASWADGSAIIQTYRINCGSCGGTNGGGVFGGYQTPEEATVRWDTRATPATDMQEVVRLREALEELEARSDAVVAALDKYNAEHGTHIGGAPFFKIGVAIAKARAALAKHPTSPEDAA